MSYGEKYLAMAADERPANGKTLTEVPSESYWWSGVVVDSILGFSTILACVLGGVLLLRRWRRQRGQAK